MTTLSFLERPRVRALDIPLPTAREMGAVYTPTRLASWVAARLITHLPDEYSARPHVLDPACGDGALLRAVGAHLPQSRLIGVDLDAASLEAARALSPIEPTLIHADALAPAGRARHSATRWAAHFKKIGARVDAVIANPPWGADLNLGRDQLREAGFNLAQGQYDSYELFVELCLDLAREDAPLAFILPDSVFLPEHRALRELLLRRTSLHLIARLGEGFFPGVYRGTVVLICQKTTAKADHQVECLRLDRAARNAILAGDLSFEDAQSAASHRIPQSRFALDGEARFDIDTDQSDARVLEKLVSRPAAWTAWLHGGRGVELSKHGQLVLCPACQTGTPRPRGTEETQIECKGCGHRYSPQRAHTQGITRRTEEPARNGDWQPFIVGEDVDRYHCAPSRLLRLGVAGINYKRPETFAERKLLVRKTGVGLKAAIDESGALTNQVVFHFTPSMLAPAYYLDYIQGVLCSRVMFAYYLKRVGENEWRSHPYITQKVLAELPIPEVTPSTECYARAIAAAVGDKAAAPARAQNAHDMAIESLVAGLYRFSTSDCLWVARVLDEAEGLEPIRTLRLAPGDTFAPISL